MDVDTTAAMVVDAEPAVAAAPQPLTAAEQLTAKLERKRRAETLLGDLKRQFTGADIVDDEHDALVLPPGECEARLATLQESIRVLLRAEEATKRAAEQRRLNAERRAMLRAKYGAEKIPEPRLEAMPKDIMSKIVDMLPYDAKCRLLGVSFAMYKFMRSNYRFRYASVTLDGHLARALHDYRFSERFMPLNLEVHQLNIKVDAGVQSQDVVQYVNPALVQVLNHFAKVNWLRVYPAQPGEWAKDWTMPPLVIPPRHNTIRVIDSPFFPHWLTLGVMDRLATARSLVVPGDRFASNKANRHWENMLTAKHSGMRQYFFPKPTTLFVFAKSSGDWCASDLISSHPTITRLVAGGTPDTTSLIRSDLCQRMCKQLRSIVFTHVLDAPEYCFDIDYLHGMCSIITLAKAADASCAIELYIPLAPLTPNPQSFSPAGCLGFSRLMALNCWPVLRWHMHPSGHRRLLALTPDSLSKDQYTQTLIWTLLAYAQHSAPFLDVEHSADYDLAPIKADAYVALLVHLRAVTTGANMTIGEQIFSDALLVATKDTSPK